MRIGHYVAFGRYNEAGTGAEFKFAVIFFAVTIVDYANNAFAYAVHYIEQRIAGVGYFGGYAVKLGHGAGRRNWSHCGGGVAVLRLRCFAGFGSSARKLRNKPIEERRRLEGVIIRAVISAWHIRC